MDAMSENSSGGPVSNSTVSNSSGSNTSGSNTSGSSGSLLAVAVGAPILVAALLGAIAPALDPAASALLLVLVIVAVTLRGDWLADLLAVLASAAGFDFFLTTPVHSLKIGSVPEIEVTVAMLLVGAAIGALSMWARSRDAAAIQRSDYLAEISRAASSHPSAASVAAALAKVLGADDGEWIEGTPPPGDALVSAPDTMVISGARSDPSRTGLPTDRFICFPAGTGYVRVSAGSKVVIPAPDQLRAACLMASRIVG